MSQDVTRSWFGVLNNPQDHGYQGTPQEICERLRDEWVLDSTTRSGAWAYCVSAEGLHHVHMVLEDEVAMRFSMVKKTYAPAAHIEPTKGSKKQAEDYIHKRHPYDEKGEQVVCVVTAGSIVGAPGKRSDLQHIGELIEAGKNPQEILDEKFAYYRYEKEIRSAYYRKRWRETPPKRDVKVNYVVGESGSGKTHMLIELCQKYGEENVCVVSDYSTNGGFDHYAGETVLFLDEFKGQLPFHVLLAIMDKYKVQVHARYTNIWSLWAEVFITSVYPPEILYELMVPPDRRSVDSRQQLYRRITDVTYCYVTPYGEHMQYTIPMTEYKDYPTVKAAAEQQSVLSLFAP